MIKVYVAGPINSPVPGKTVDELKQEFHDLKAWLDRNYGNWQVVLPMEVENLCDGHCLKLEGGSGRPHDPEHTWECWLKWDMIGMLKCDAIVLLPHANLSAGARLEFRTAKAVHMKVYVASRTEMKGWTIRNG